MERSVQEFSSKIIDNVERVIVGKRSVVELLLVALLCEGHVLIEDVPGTGKTMLARSIAISLGGMFKRIQCTPDLLPNDVTGVSIFNLQTNQFEFRPGPIFVNLLLADEINRATPRTQSALLEAMQEQQVTIDGETHQLPRPFIVLATQNPIEYEGTFPLPEAQLDRFLIRLPVGYPTPVDEKKILVNLQREHPITELKPVSFLSEPDETATSEGLDRMLEFQRKVWEIYVDDTLHDYIIRIINETRSHPDLALGGSTRASLALFKTAQALAAIRGRDHVIPDDVKYLTPLTLTHRLIVKPESELRGRTAGRIIQDLLHKIPLDIGSLA